MIMNGDYEMIDLEGRSCGLFQNTLPGQTEGRQYSSSGL
jgi:hypothetical protein